MTIRTALLTFAALLIAGPAVAQPSAYAPPPPPEAVPPPVQVEPAPAPSKLSVGLHLFGGELLNPNNPAEDAEISGQGIFGRYRLSRRWEIELELSKSSAVIADGWVRDFRSVDGSLLFHVFQRGKLDGYLRAGIGMADESFTAEGDVFEFENQSSHFGAGLEYQLTPKLGIAGEFRGAALSRGDEFSVEQSGGTRLGLAAVYHF